MRPKVIIAGGGPAGLMLAGELRLAGTEVTVLERRREPHRLSRAPGVYARTLEIFEQRGLLARMPEGRPARAAHFALLAGLNMGELDSEHAVMMVPQATVERVLAEWATELGVRLLPGHELTGFREVPGAVEADVAGPERPYRLRG